MNVKELKKGMLVHNDIGWISMQCTCWNSHAPAVFLDWTPMLNEYIMLTILYEDKVLDIPLTPHSTEQYLHAY